MKIEMLYEDDAIMVCYKPAMIATQTKKIGQLDMESLLRNYRAKKKEPTFVGVVHRLDQPVEGVMVFAKTSEAAAKLSEQVRLRSIGKHYYAVADGTLFSGEDEGVLEDYISFDPKSNVSRIVNAQEPGAKKAKLEYRIIERKDNKIYADILLHTGRHHQIRLQFANAKMPLVGDLKYGTNETTGNGLALCSYRLEFVHPQTGKKMVFSIKPRGAEFASFLDKDTVRL